MGVGAHGRGAMSLYAWEVIGLVCWAGFCLWMFIKK